MFERPMRTFSLVVPAFTVIGRPAALLGVILCCRTFVNRSWRQAQMKIDDSWFQFVDAYDL